VCVVPEMTVLEGRVKDPVPVTTGGVMGGSRVMVSVPWVMVVGVVAEVGRVKMPVPGMEVMTLPGGGGPVLLIPVLLLAPELVGTGGRTVNVVPPVVMVVRAVTLGMVKISPFSGSVTTEGVDVGATTGGETVKVVPPVVIVVGAVTLGSVNVSPFSGRVTTDDVGATGGCGGWPGGRDAGGGGSAVSVVPPVTMVLGAVTLGKVNTSVLGSVVVMPGVPLPGPGGGGGGGGGRGTEVAGGGGFMVKVAPPVTSVEGAVTWGRVRVLVPMMMWLPLEMMVCPSVPVVVRTLVAAGGEATGGAEVGGGKTVKVWLSVDSVTGAVPVTTGTEMVAVPPMMMTETV